MSPPKVFISATSADLGPTRQVVKEALLTIGCMPVEQTNFPPDWRSVAQMLREKIGDCQALIHIVGLHYGAEPDPSSLPAGDPRRSYTQMEYDIGCELQRKRGDRRFRVYTLICPDNFPFRAVPVPDGNEERELQAQHRNRIQEGAALYERPNDPDALRTRVLALREEVLTLRAAQDRRVQLTLAGVLLIVLTLAGIGFGVYQSRLDIAGLPTKTAEEVSRQFNPEAVATRLTQEIHARFERDAQAARVAGQKWEFIRDLERSRDAALGRVDEVIRTIKEGLAGNPVPIFIESTRILEEEGEVAALSYLESHKIDQLARADRAAAQVEAARESLQRELQPLMLQAGLHETRLEWDEALDLMQVVVEKAPRWFQVRNNLGVLLYTLARYAEAEPHLRAALPLAENQFEEAAALNNLAALLRATNRLDEAEPLYRRALAINEASYGSEHPNVANSLGSLADVLQATNRLAEAEPLFRRALAINEVSYGSEHPNVAISLGNLARLLQATNRLAEAEPLYRRALAINEASYGSEHPTVAGILNSLATLLYATNRLSEAELLMRRSLAIDEASFGGEHPLVARDLGNLALLLQDTNRLSEAEPLMRRSLAIAEASYGREDPNVATNLNNLAAFLQATNRLDEAEPLYRRALAIDEASYGSEHPRVARDLNNLAQLLRMSNRLDEVEPLYRRALAIDEASFGGEHPRVSTKLNNLALLLQKTNRLAEAEPLMRRSVDILLVFTQRTGYEHPNLNVALENYRSVLAAMGRDEAEQQEVIDALVESVRQIGSLSIGD